MTFKINLSFFSNSRSEFGLINQIIQKLKKYKKFKYTIFLSGTHFSNKYGNSLNEIKFANIKYVKVFKYNLDIASEKNIIKNLSLNTISLSRIFKKIDNVILFGDRIDLYPIALNCLIYNKKIIHFGGGEETKGSIDNKVRKFISNLAELHFVSSNNYKKNLIKTGISKNKIFNVGTLSVNKKMLINNDINNFEKKKNQKLISLTYHPVNINSSISAINQIKIILEALNTFKKKFFVIINSPGYEIKSEEIIKYINKWIKGKQNYQFYSSLGIDKYSNLIKNSKFIIGNSSSGVIMAPYFNTPSINIGNRQDGRILHSSVINSKLNKNEIILAINKILKKKKERKKLKYLLGSGDAAEKSARIMNKILI